MLCDIFCSEPCLCQKYCGCIRFTVCNIKGTVTLDVNKYYGYICGQNPNKHEIQSCLRNVRALCAFVLRNTTLVIAKLLQILIPVLYVIALIGESNNKGCIYVLQYVFLSFISESK